MVKKLKMSSGVQMGQGSLGMKRILVAHGMSVQQQVNTNIDLST